MSLAFNAAPFNDDSENQNNYISNKKKQTHSKTQKNFLKESFDKKKVNGVLEQIHNLNQDDEEDEDNFNPPPNPESSGVSKTIANEDMSNMSNNMNQQMFRTLGRSPEPNSDDANLDMNNYNNYGDKKTIDEYYKNMIAGYNPGKNPINKQYNNRSNNQVDVKEEDLLIKKLNYMISLLEDQQDERTNTVTEEVVLYSFLGIFIIFVIDSFVRVGKYTR
jgi:hypothetical protein